MIGSRLRRAATMLLAVAASVALMGPGGPRPEVDIAARRMIEEAADAAGAALTGLSSALGPAVDAGRAGSARAVAGDEAPGPRLREAADLVRSAVAEADTAGRALTALDGARRADDPAAPPLDAVTAPGELDSIADQLIASADAADDFAAMRRRAASVVAELEAGLAALDAGDLEAARDHVAAARERHAIVAAWDVGLVTLPIWVDTTDAMIGAVERIIEATERGDAAAAEAAAQEFAALAGDAATADRALRIAIGEGGSAVAAVPLERLAAILARIDDARAAVASIGAGAAP